MNVNSDIRVKVQQTLSERGETQTVLAPGQPGWKEFLNWLRQHHPDLWETLMIEGVEYKGLHSPHQQEQAKTQGRAHRRHLFNLLTREVDDLTGEWVLSRPKLWLWSGLGVALVCGGLLWGSALTQPASSPAQTASAITPTPQPPVAVAPPPVPKPPSVKPAVETRGNNGNASAPALTNLPSTRATPKPPTALPETPPPLPTVRYQASVAPPPEPVPTISYRPAVPLPSSPPVQIAQPRPVLPVFAPPPEPARAAPTPKTKPLVTPQNQTDLGGDFSFFSQDSEPAEALQVPAEPRESSTEDGGFYLTQNASSQPANSVQIGQFYEGRLASDLILTEGGRMTAVVLSGSSVWQGEASLNPAKRVEVRLTSVSVGGQNQAVNATVYGLEGNRRVPGLSAQFQDQAPALAADAVRAALRGVSRYVDLGNQGGSTVVSGGVVVNQPSAPDLLKNVAGSLADLLALPPAEKGLVRVAWVGQGTPVQILVLGEAR